MKNTPPLPLDEALLRVAVPLAAMAAMAVFAAREPAAAAEGAYLAALAGAALLAVAFLAPAPAVELGVGATLAAAVVWALPEGPGRGATMMLLLTALLAVAAVRRLAGCWPDLPFTTVLPLAVGLQVLLRGELLFHPQANLRTLVALLVLPAAGGAAATLLARRHGGGPVLVAAGTALLLAPGWNVAVTLGLAALAAGDQLARPELGRIAKGTALLVLLAPIVWGPAPGIAAACAGLALWRPRVAAGLVVPVSVLILWLGARSFPVGWTLLDAIWFVPILVPGALLPERARLWNVLTAIPLIVATPHLPDASVLAAPLALAALAIRRERTIPQRVWTGALLGGTCLLAAYPWLRAQPLAAALALAGLEIGWRSGVAVLGVFVILAAGLRRVILSASRASGKDLGGGPFLPPDPLGRRGSPQDDIEEPQSQIRLGGEGLLAAAAMLVALFFHLPPVGTALLVPETGVLLEPSQPAWVAGYPTARPASGVVVESSLSGGASLVNGTAVATVRTDDGAGRSVLWVLRAGEGTGEWAALRPDVVGTARLRSPPAWISWVAGDFFGHRYRTAWTLPEGFRRLREVRVELARGLPPDVGVTLHQVEIRR